MRITAWIPGLIVNCVVAAALLPAAAASERAGIGSTLTFGGVTNASPDRMPIAPWWQSTFVLVREDGSFEPRPIVDLIEPAPAPTPAARPAPVTLDAPGVVEGLRRTDQR